MRALVWLLRALVFFTLFAFALNNQQDAVVRWFFGVEWRAPMVIVVLVAFAAGCAFGVVAMMPSWWRQRRWGRRAAAGAVPSAADARPAAEPLPDHPPREGL
ncbi:LapA family protein [Azohydromonas sediminis]|uniref:LapA family protein n=1 Tax=Azohydromonas sediminis TaxID=2259674 RepID=UPI000E65E48C|nr:LapA family protein [Azohydromonas sediminis]